MSKLIMGVDPGLLHHGLVLLKLHDTYEIECVDIASAKYEKSLSTEVKLERIYSAMSMFLRKWNVNIAAFETQYLGQNVSTLRRLSEAVGCMKLCTRHFSSAEIIDYTPSEMKLAATGKGGGKKEDMAKAAFEILGIQDYSVDNDEADAAAAALSYVVYTPEIVLPILEQAGEYNVAEPFNRWNKLTVGKKRAAKKAARDILIDRQVLKVIKR